jgi:hypothetical protein
MCMHIDNRMFQAMDIGSDGLLFVNFGFSERGRLMVQVARENLERYGNLGAGLVLESMYESAMESPLRA